MWADGPRKGDTRPENTALRRKEGASIIATRDTNYTTSRAVANRYYEFTKMHHGGKSE